MAEIVANRLRFHVQRLAPNGSTSADYPTVVFLHGLAVDDLSSFYYTLAGPVSKAGAEVILYDQRGQGRSERPATGYRLEDAVGDLFAILDTLDRSQPVHLVGNSYGGILAGLAALERPDRVAGVVFIDSCCAGAAVEAWLESMLNTLSAAALLYEYDRLDEQCAAVGWRKIARQVRGMSGLLSETTLIEDLAASPPVDPTRLAEIVCPVLGIFGERSDMVAAAGDLTRHVPDCTLAILPGMAHTVLRESTAVLCEVVVSWLREHGPSPRTAALGGGESR
ncbi:alpha/beta fold hydrolase [Nocardia nepalensis]|uniref:alpha/beta fold hydrolase n=1 Tax=Nocardia nepalensis TaxID=3375448 RepID=UPI003B6834CF